MSHQNRFPDTHTSQQPPRNPTPQFPPSQGGYHWSCNFCNSVFWTREQSEQHRFHCPEKTDTQTQLPYPQLAVRAHTPHKYSGAYDGMSQQSLPPPRGIYPYSTAVYSQRPLQHDPTHSTAAHFQHPVPDPIPRYPPPSQIQYPTPRASPGIDLQYSTSYLPAMAASSVSQSRDNLLEALRMLVEERKKEAREVFLELRTELEQCEERVNKELCELYSDTRERIERDEKKIGKLETAKGNLQTDLVDNEFNSILQTTMDNFDAQIAEIRRSSVTIPRDVELEWNKEEFKKSIERVCRIVSSDGDARQTVKASGGISHPYEEEKVLSEQLKQAEVEIQRLKKENEVVKEKLKTAEEKSQTNIVKLKARIADKEKEMSHRNEELQNAQEELGSALRKAQNLLASKLNSKKEFVGVGQDEDDSMFSMSQCFGPEFKRSSVVSSNIDETGGQNVRKQQNSSDEQGIKELSKQVPELNRFVEEMRTELELHRKENHSLKGKLNTSKRELEIVSDKLVQSEQNLSAVQTYLDEAHYKGKEAQNETAGKNKDISASRPNPATHKKDDKNTPKQPKYKYTDISVGRKYVKTYTLSQVEDLVEYLGGVVFCRPRTHNTTEYVAGTLQTIIPPPRYSYEKTVAGIEFVDPLGDCDGELNYKRYFTSKPKHALFIATDMVYIPWQDPK